MWTLRQRRYAGLAALMVVVALICVGAGTFEVTRFQQKTRQNGALVANADAAPAPITATPVPLVGHGPAPDRFAIEYRTVTARGVFAADQQQLVRGQSLDDTSGFYVLTPLRSADAVVLVVRGFVAGATGQSPSVPAPPAGLVQIAGRLQTAATTPDAAAGGEVDSINPAEQSARLGQPVYDAYLTLTAGQPGTSGVQVLPAPDLSNPTGGAIGPQLLAYIVQWYLFALLALAAPFAMARHEIREAQRRFLGVDAGSAQLDAAEHDPQPALTGSTSSDAALAVRGTTSLARREDTAPQRWRRAVRLADRYGRSLGPSSGDPASAALAPSSDETTDRPAVRGDAYRNAYNDYLWQLALADGTIRPVTDDGGSKEHAPPGIGGSPGRRPPAPTED